ncbi:MAG TPA: hypothetical protein DEB17_01380 [Chlorobaculum sp.]|uniref:Uncharacterized protein n=1 Tax=Chlorobaculum tepidum (strain ATCC 49652 / DSM 12025 / NBRC 103806 / TLS) TaxID=194439 RepID=Q8KCG2_CHLTE|nr:hypothetical protein CT1459 [Chlorobaculum tepidum TLS]HBU22651.1 hypothetical protein [Chlorobaculum sp.]
MMKHNTIKIIAASAVFSISTGIFAPSFCLSNAATGATNIQGNQNIVAGGNVLIYHGLSAKQ